MAKSLRSKRRRKVRAEKRVVNAKKELVKLHEVAARLHGLVDPDSGCLTKQSLESMAGVKVSESAVMDVDGASLGRKKAPGGINNQWMNQRKIKALKNRIKRHNRQKARKPSSATVGSRKAKKSLNKKK